MSRIGKKIIRIPSGVTVTVSADTVNANGPKGQLSLRVSRDVVVEIKDNTLSVSLRKEESSKNAKALWGLYRALIFNMIEGVSKGFEKKLEIEGVGYKAALQGDTLVLNLGF